MIVGKSNLFTTFFIFPNYKEKQKALYIYLHLNLSKIFPPQMVASAVFTTKTDILPRPSLKWFERSLHHRLFWKSVCKLKKEQHNFALLRSKKPILTSSYYCLALLHSVRVCNIKVVNSLNFHFTSHGNSECRKARTWEYISSRRLSEGMLLTGHRLPAGSWAAGLWIAPHWSGGWWACACSAGRKWWTVPFQGGPPRGQRWGPWCWCHSLGKPRWHSKCLPGALGGKREGKMEKGKMSAGCRRRRRTFDCMALTVAFLLHKSQFAGSSVCW